MLCCHRSLELGPCWPTPECPPGHSPAAISGSDPESGAPYASGYAGLPVAVTGLGRGLRRSVAAIDSLESQLAAADGSAGYLRRLGSRLQRGIARVRRGGERLASGSDRIVRGADRLGDGHHRNGPLLRGGAIMAATNQPTNWQARLSAAMKKDPKKAADLNMRV